MENFVEALWRISSDRSSLYTRRFLGNVRVYLERDNSYGVDRSMAQGW